MLGLLFVSYWALAWFTHHNESVKVPDLRGITYDQLKANLGHYDLDFVINDSTFTEGKPKGIILDQYPIPGSSVKPGRKIYIKINMYSIPKIKMPKIVDASFRQARDMLESYGLKLGKVTFKENICENCILGMSIAGKEVKAGDMILRNSTIELLVGDGLGNTLIPIPNLQGLTLEDATFLLKASSLDIGAKVYDDDVTDKANAVVYRQIPEALNAANLNDLTEEQRKEKQKLEQQINIASKKGIQYELIEENKPGYIRLGETIDLWFTNSVIIPTEGDNNNTDNNPFNYDDEYNNDGAVADDTTTANP